MSVEMTAGVLVARMMEGMQFVLGPTMAFRRDVIRQMGGFKVTADYCADDFVLGNETFKLGQTVVLSHHAIDHIVINLEPRVLTEAPGALDEVDALFAAQGTFWHGAYVQHAVWVAGCLRRLCWAIRGGVWRCWHGRGDAADVVDCRGPHGRARSKLVQSAGAVSGARPDGFFLLGSELHGQPDSVARAGVSTAAGGKMRAAVRYANSRLCALPTRLRRRR